MNGSNRLIIICHQITPGSTLCPCVYSGDNHLLCTADADQVIDRSSEQVMHVMIMEICCLYLCNDDNSVSRDLCATAMVYI